MGLGGVSPAGSFSARPKSADVGEDGSTMTYPAGFVHLPRIDAEFVQQLCAEQLVTRRNRSGYPVREWQKMRERNEGLDCAIYSRAAAAAAGLDRFEDRHWRELERQLGLDSPPDLPDPPHPSQSPENTHETSAQATEFGGLGASGPANPQRRRVVRSRWMN